MNRSRYLYHIFCLWSSIGVNIVFPLKLPASEGWIFSKVKVFDKVDRLLNLAETQFYKICLAPSCLFWVLRYLATPQVIAWGLALKCAQEISIFTKIVLFSATLKENIYTNFVPYHQQLSCCFQGPVCICIVRAVMYKGESLLTVITSLA